MTDECRARFSRSEPVVGLRAASLWGPALGRPDPATCFTVGLLSVADALLAVPMDALPEELEELDTPVKRALVAREGSLGAQLRLVEHYELGRLDELDDAGRIPSAAARSVGGEGEAAERLLAQVVLGGQPQGRPAYRRPAGPIACLPSEE